MNRYSAFVGLWLVTGMVAADVDVDANPAARPATAADSATPAASDQSAVGPAAPSGEEEPGSDTQADGQVPAAEPGMLEMSGEWLESQRDQLTDLYTGSAESIDRYVAGDFYDPTTVNESYIRLQLRQLLREGDGLEHEVKLRLKLDLPAASRRFKLVFDSQPDDFETLGDKRRDTVDRDSENDGGVLDNAEGGVAFEQLERVWKRRLNVGVRLGIPLNPFVRLRFQRDWEWPVWTASSRHTLSYFHEERAKYETDLNWLRPFGENFYFQSGSGAQFLDNNNTWELYQGLSIHQRLAEDMSLEYQIGTTAFSRPDLKIEQYWVRTTWSKRLYKDWLFLNIIPELLFTRENDFDVQPGILLELEVFAHKNGNRRVINGLFVSKQ